MWQIFIGSFVLSLIHAAIPNHWIPIIAIGKTEQWTLKETLWVTIITGLAHTLSTVLIGVVVGFVGLKLSDSYSLIMQYFAPGILIMIGFIYIFSGIIRNADHHHTKSEYQGNLKRVKTKTGILISLSLSMFLTPCVEIEAYYFQAGMIGWEGIFIVSAVYTIATISLMVLLVYSGFKATYKFKSHILEHYEKLITGSVLVVLGLLALLVRY